LCDGTGGTGVFGGTSPQPHAREDPTSARVGDESGDDASATGDDGGDRETEDGGAARNRELAAEECEGDEGGGDVGADGRCGVDGVCLRVYRGQADREGGEMAARNTGGGESVEEAGGDAPEAGGGTE